MTIPLGYTPGYTAPEILLQDGANEKADIFGSGVTLVTIQSQSEPWGIGSKLQPPTGCLS